MKRKKVLLGVGVLLAISLIIGVSYAYWRFTISQTGLNKLTSSCLELTLSKEGDAINLEKAYPITDEEAKVVITYSPSTYSPIENGITTLHDAILANEYQTTDIQTAINKINQKQEPDFTKTAPIIDWQENSTTSSGTLSYKIMQLI